MSELLSRKIQTIRQARGFSQEELARRLGVSFPTVNAWERGKSRPYPRHLKAIEDLYAEVMREAGRRQVLIVEDDEASGQLLADYVALALPEWQAQVVTNGYDAILRIGMLKPAIVLLDIMMPGIDGLEVHARIREKPDLGHVRVVFVTAASDEAVLARARAAGAFALVQKPVRREAMVALLQRAAEGDGP